MLSPLSPLRRSIAPLVLFGLAALLLASKAKGAETPSHCKPVDTVLAAASADERTAFNARLPLLREIDVEGRHWPRVCAYELINATPAEAMAVLTDFATPQSYMPHVETSGLVPGGDSGPVKRVYYRISLGFMGLHEIDTLQEVLSRDASVGADAYRLTWHRLASIRSEIIDGSAAFAPYAAAPQPTTVVVYEQNVEPYNALVKRMLKRKAVAAVRDVMIALAKQTEGERMHQPVLLQRQVAELNHTLETPTDQSPLK